MLDVYFFTAVAFIFTSPAVGHDHRDLPESAYLNSSTMEHALETPKRKAPKYVSLTSGGIRYQQGIQSRSDGRQCGGWIDAIESSSGILLWSKQIYDMPFDLAEERDVQEVFIIDIQMNLAQTSLLLTDERKRKWELHLADRAVTPRDR